MANVPLADTLWCHKEKDVNVDTAYGGDGERDLVLRYTPDDVSGAPRMLLSVLRADGGVKTGRVRVNDRHVRIQDVKVAARKGFAITEASRTASFAVGSVEPQVEVVAWPFVQARDFPVTSMEGGAVPVDG